MKNTTKIIKVNKSKDLQFNFKTSRHGPVVSGVLELLAIHHLLLCHGYYPSRESLIESHL